MTNPVEHAAQLFYRVRSNFGIALDRRPGRRYMLQALDLGPEDQPQQGSQDHVLEHVVEHGVPRAQSL